MISDILKINPMEHKAPCVQYTSHCNENRDSNKCCFCGINTSEFTKEEWDDLCPGAIKQNIRIQHNYVVGNVWGMAVREHDYVQFIKYHCTNCGSEYIERDDQR